MTEKRATYNVKSKSTGITPGALLDFTHEDYTPPTPADVRALKAMSEKTGRELCELIGIEDQRSWRRWSQEPEEPSARQIPYSAWRLLLLELGFVKPGRTKTVAKSRQSGKQQAESV